MARSAAKFSICANLQAPDVFWRLHDFLVARQNEITPANLTSMVASFARQQEGIDTSRLLACAVEREAEELLLRDEKLAQAYHVDRTPPFLLMVYGALVSARLRNCAQQFTPPSSTQEEEILNEIGDRHRSRIGCALGKRTRTASGAGDL